MSESKQLEIQILNYIKLYQTPQKLQTPLKFLGWPCCLRFSTVDVQRKSLRLGSRDLAIRTKIQNNVMHTFLAIDSDIIDPKIPEKKKG